MEHINSYYLIISASLIIIISYLFNVVSRKTNIPSVLLLITLGLLIKAGLVIAGYEDINWMPALEVLGIIGLIMIVLESALDLELSKDKWKVISKAFLVSFLSLALNVYVIANIYRLFFVIDFFTAALYATPISIISSAIVIPSIGSMAEDKKEFLIYESTFSDILGIIIFYSLLMFPKFDAVSSFTIKVSLMFIVTIVLAFLLAYLLLYLAQKIKTPLKLYLLISILILFYAIGKVFHLSSLIIILFFGLIMNNRHLFIPKFLRSKFDENALSAITNDIKLITLETSFIVRTFFFVIFGITLVLSTIADFKVIVITFLLLVVIY
jgi:NhaP-type Na+/H+ or K+/H+ antiporter